MSHPKPVFQNHLATPCFANLFFYDLLFRALAIANECVLVLESNKLVFPAFEIIH
jgi:hypothetical protein